MKPEKAKGTRFEIWMERLLKDNSYHQVRRDIEYHRQRYQYRQVDLEYFSFLSFSRSFVILELKYASNGKVGLGIRGGKKRKAHQMIATIDNVVVELEERRRFVKADHSILVTNGYFEPDVIAEARRYNIGIWQREKLLELNSKRRGVLGYFFPPNGGIEAQIRSIALHKYDPKTHTVYI